jgi:hypothetical protein
MAGFRAISLYLLGIVAGFGAALVSLAQLLDPGQELRSLDSISACTAGVLLVGTSLIGGIEVARGTRTWRLRTALLTIALMADVLGGGAALRRRAEHLKGLESRHREQGNRLAHRGMEAFFGRPIMSMDMGYNKGDFTGEAASLLRQAHWHRGMSEIYHLAAARPWLPVRPLVPCDCRVCSVVGGAKPDPLTTLYRWSAGRAAVPGREEAGGHE